MDKQNNTLAALAVVSVILIAIGAGFLGAELPRLVRMIGPGEPRPGSADISQTYGAQVYQGRCAHCHGPDARGRIGFAPALVGSSISPSYLTSKRVWEAVTNGVARPGRPGMARIEGLGEDDILALTQYLRSLGDAHQ